MTYRGQVKNGQIMLDEPALLPEGAHVNVEVAEQGADFSTAAAREASELRADSDARGFPCG